MTALCNRFPALHAPTALVAPRFTLRVFDQAGRLRIQGSGQAALDAEVVGPDRIAVKAVGAELEFKRDATGTVNAAVLRQRGQTLEGPKRPRP